MATLGIRLLQLQVRAWSSLHNSGELLVRMLPRGPAVEHSSDGLRLAAQGSHHLSLVQGDVSGRV